MLYNLHFFSSKCRLFHNATLFGFCITHILNTGCAKMWKKVRRQKVNIAVYIGLGGWRSSGYNTLTLRSVFIAIFRSKVTMWVACDDVVS